MQPCTREVYKTLDTQQGGGHTMQHMQSCMGEVYKVLNTQEGRGLHHAAMYEGGV